MALGGTGVLMRKIPAAISWTLVPDWVSVPGGALPPGRDGCRAGETLHGRGGSTVRGDHRRRRRRRPPVVLAASATSYARRAATKVASSPPRSGWVRSAAARK